MLSSAQLAEAAAAGDVSVVTALLADGRADPASEDSIALLNAAQAGHLDVVAAAVASAAAVVARERVRSWA
jgi:hypothetical protein